jgi:hypothetical protein
MLAHGSEDRAKQSGPVKKEHKAWGIAAIGDLIRRPEPPA